MKRATLFQRPLPFASALILWTLACTSTATRERLATTEDRSSPTLEEIFLLPGIQGRAPQIQALSADGRWIAFQFNALETAADGSRSLGKTRGLRIQSTANPAVPGQCGQIVEDLLQERAPQVEGETPKRTEEVRLAWSNRGARALALRDRELFLLDPPIAADASWAVKLLLRAEPEGELKSLSSARFSEDDRALLVNVGKDLWRFALVGDPTPVWPLSAADGVNLTAAIDVDVGKLSLSRNLAVAFSREPAVASIAVPAAEDKPASKTPAQVLWLDSGLAVELEGMAEMKALENAQISPDGRFLFGVWTDRSLESAPTLIPDYLSTRVSVRDGRRDLAENPPAPRQLYLWDTRSGARTLLSTGEEPAFWLRTIGWAPQPAADSPPRLALARESADFRTLETFLWSESTGLVRAMVDRDERWIGGPADRARWSSDGARLIFGSESLESSTLPGRAQLFAYDVATGDLRQLTQVSGEVSSFDIARDGGIVFSHSDDGAWEQRKLGYISPTGAVLEIPAPVGFNTDPQLALEGTRVVFMHGRMFQPAEIWSSETIPSAKPRALTHTAPVEFTARPWIWPHLFEVRGERDARVRSHVFLPQCSSLERPDRERPCVVFIHGAGYLQNVTDSMTEYEPNLMFHSRLAEMGYVVVDVDYRGSSGYGQDFRTAAQYRLGELELKDINDTLDQLAARGVIDRAKVACYGGSYGGFLTLMALFKEGERWSAGAALRSVTDWRTYHPGYTQPRLGRPSTHAEAYVFSSPIDHAEGLSKPLLLLHGMLDSNVFAQDTIRLIEKLIDLGKDFDAMLYPSQNHAFSDGAHWLDEYKRIERFLRQHLGEP